MFYSVLESLSVIKGIYLQGNVLVHNALLCIRTLCLNYLTKIFLLASSSVSRKQLKCFVYAEGQKRGQNRTTTTENFVEFHNHLPLLTVRPWTFQHESWHLCLLFDVYRLHNHSLLLIMIRKTKLSLHWFFNYYTNSRLML